ncbi:MAG: hypothetical protein RLN84_01150 [Rhodospirillaceae bacterium]
MSKHLEETARDKMWRAIISFSRDLEEIPGRKKWVQRKIALTLHAADVDTCEGEVEKLTDFEFPDEIEKQRIIIMAYLALADSVTALKECEYYFRRYPFRNLPVTKHRHIVNVCEMYFSRFYEIRSRLKNVLNAANKVISDKKFDVGAFIKLFDRIFDSEIRQRHGVHHRERFDDVDVSRIFLMETLATRQAVKNLHVGEYRQIANSWISRVRTQGKKVDEFLEAVANALIENCDFLKPEEGRTKRK